MMISNLLHLFPLGLYTLAFLILLMFAAMASGLILTGMSILDQVRSNHYQCVAVGCLLKPRKTLKQIVRDAFIRIN